ncbi:beta-galactosidase [Grosmannia clavigera kw1407]|uniref:Beta-galactosidase n=1 Tax=Grosmannia clavigera (strain kw1407 / UAMH 11150) TaxID=655863 RepID=F0XST5_GROCL|nr:beta-galactosidase [Grosmannia clavigera kw1407]EFW99297.1 beta-galactosidase [Grosmannia clavigera kw1407]
MVSFRTLLTALGAVGAAFASTDGLTDLVTWDNFSLSINGTRVFIQSAEFHYQRLPVPDLWPDVFQKFKANGFNTISIYFFWSYHSASKGVFDFESPGKDVQRLLDAAKDAGLWVIARAGPYCNAETNGGSLALWGSDGSLGRMRTSDETYHQAWLPWVSKIGALIAKNQITNGGPVILNQVENEFVESVHSANSTQVLYMEQLKTAFRDAGVIVPFTHNEKGMRANSWSTDYENVGGAVNVYGLDSYPGGLSCTNVNTGFNVVRTYYQWFQKYAPSQPISIPEFEGGWFSAWGDSAFYDDNNVGQRVTSQNIYMTFGGTNWGHSAAPVVYTSYDYSAPLRETRQQTTKLFQTKLINMFDTSSPDLLKTVMVGNGTGFHLSSKALFSWVLQNPDTGATFTVIQQSSTPSTSNVTASATLNTSAGSVVVPDVALYGRQSKILVTDYLLGGGAGSNNNTILYCSADIATSSTFGSADVLVLYLKEGQTGEFSFRDTANLTFTVYGNSQVTANSSSHQSFTYVQDSGATAVVFSNKVIVYLLDQPTAWRFWAPANGKPQSSPLEVFKSDRLFILGPYLVRSAEVDWSKGTLSIVGDSDAVTTLEAFVGFGPQDSSSGSYTTIHTIEWNGQALTAERTAYGAYRAKIPGGADLWTAAQIPSLKDATWYVADSLPEADPSYDDSRWVVCNKTTTASPSAPRTLPVLFSSDYGFYAGTKVYRGRFSFDELESAPTAVNLTASGGVGFGWTAWLNGQLLGGDVGTASLGTSSAELALTASSLLESDEGDNVLTVLVDYHGHDEENVAHGLENPRGLLGAQLLYGDNEVSNGSYTGFSSWRLTGNAGGPANIDAVRGPMNEGGLYAERLGWHLPGFDAASDTAFQLGSPLDSNSSNGAGVRFYVTTFQLNGGKGLDPSLDVPLGIQFAAPTDTMARVMLWINGYQYGKYVPHLGPQTRFPVPPGILNVGAGENNTLAISVWAMTEDGATLSEVSLVDYDGAYETGYSAAATGGDAASREALQPKWTNRAKYA